MPWSLLLLLLICNNIGFLVRNRCDNGRDGVKADGQNNEDAHIIMLCIVATTNSRENRFSRRGCIMPMVLVGTLLGIVIELKL